MSIVRMNTPRDLVIRQFLKRMNNDTRARGIVGSREYSTKRVGGSQFVDSIL